MSVTSGLKSIEGEDVWGFDPELDGRGLKVPYLTKVQRSKIFKGTGQTGGIAEHIEEVSAELQCKLELADHFMLHILVMTILLTKKAFLVYLSTLYFLYCILRWVFQHMSPKQSLFLHIIYCIFNTSISYEIPSLGFFLISTC